MLEEGKIYIVKVDSGNVWLFKKSIYSVYPDEKTGHSRALCLKDTYTSVEEGFVCYNREIKWIKPANENHIAIWNRVFNDNI
jgi:hypothetical protein